MTNLPTQAVDVTVVVPALNEESRIRDTLQSVLGVADALAPLSLEVVVVDDGSTDGTAQVAGDFSAADSRVRLVRNPRNLGLGASVKSGLAHARGRKLLIVPGDNDMPAATLAELLRHAQAADLVMCFFLNREQRGRMRNFLSTLFGLSYATCFDVYVQYINGPCLYPVARLRELTLFSNRFSIVAEINVKLLRRGVSFLEIPSYRQTGLTGSTSFSLRNLRETLAVFGRLCWEIHGKNRSLYRARPRRVHAP